MISDDILAICMDVGHKKSAVGYTGDDCPRYSTSSLCGTRVSEGKMDIEVENGYKLDPSPLIFGENLTCRFKDVKYHNLLEKETGRFW